MRHEGGANAANSAYRSSIDRKSYRPWRALRQQRRPCGIGSEARRRDPLFVTPGEIDGVERGTRGAARIPEEHDHAAVRGEGRPLVVEALGQDALAGAVGLDDADRETAAPCLVNAMTSPRGDHTGVE